MFRATHIRTKLAVALAVPLAGLVAVAGFEVVSAVQDVAATRSQTELASASLGPGSLITRLQDERNRSAIDLLGLREAAGPSAASEGDSRKAVDGAATDLRAALDGRGSGVTAAFAPAWKEFAALEQLRRDIDAQTGPAGASADGFADQAFTRYTGIIESFFDATSAVALSVDDATLRNGVELVDAAARQSEVRARIVRRIVIAVATRTTASPAAGREVASLRDRGGVLDDDIRTNATGPYAGVADATFAEAGVQGFNRQVEAFLDGREVVIPDLLVGVRTEPDSGYLGLRSRAADALTREASRVEDAAAARERLFGGIALGMLLVAGLVTWLASRSITRPLASLQVQAEDMAGTHLPEALRRILDTPSGDDVVIPEIAPIRVKSRDEVADVAAALSAVQTSALDLAVEQAVLRRNIADSYINLGRRNQNLLSRQIDFITELERNEADPDTLEGLFRLDHLATRMRRNAESLLVLAGIEPPRQWAVPVKLSDVVRAALGEVEDYQRVVVRHLEPAAVTGAVASDIAHITAELIENALSFSPADQPVEVKGRLTIDGYTLAVSDNGVGIAPDDLERANRRLAGAESFTVAPSRYLGHYVAGHLASRLGVVVELQPSPAGGITARVDVPMGLLANEETDPRLVGLDSAAPASPDPQPEPPPAADSSPVPVEPAPPAVVAAEAPPTTASSFTAGGLPRRGERAPATEPLDLDAPIASFLERAEVRVADAVAAPTPPAAAHLARETAPDTLADVPQPPVPPASGFGGLVVARPTGPSMYTVAAQRAKEKTSASPASDTTSAGLTRRVPGAQRPDASFGGLRSADPEPMVAEPGRSTPDDVYSFLSSFQSGVARGLADAQADADFPEDDR